MIPFNRLCRNVKGGSLSSLLFQTRYTLCTIYFAFNVYASFHTGGSLLFSPSSLTYKYRQPLVNAFCCRQSRSKLIGTKCYLYKFYSFSNTILGWSFSYSYKKNRQTLSLFCDILATVVFQSGSSTESVLSASESPIHLFLLWNIQLGLLLPPPSCSALSSQSWHQLLCLRKFRPVRKHYRVSEVACLRNWKSLVM